MGLFDMFKGKKNDAPKGTEETIEKLSYSGLQEFIDKNIDLGSQDLKSVHLDSDSDSYVLFFNGERLISVEGKIRFKSYVEKIFSEEFDIAEPDSIKSLNDYINISNLVGAEDKETIDESFLKYMFLQLRDVDNLLKSGKTVSVYKEVYQIDATGLLDFDFVKAYFKHEKDLNHTLKLLHVEEISDNVTLELLKQHTPQTYEEQRVLQVAQAKGSIVELYKDYRFLPADLFDAVNDLDRENIIKLNGVKEEEPMPEIDLMTESPAMPEVDEEPVIEEPHSVEEEIAEQTLYGDLPTEEELNESYVEEGGLYSGEEYEEFAEEFPLVEEDYEEEVAPVNHSASGLLRDSFSVEDYGSVAELIENEDKAHERVVEVERTFESKIASFTTDVDAYLASYRDNEDRHAVKDEYEAIVSRRAELEEIQESLVKMNNYRGNNLMNVVYKSDFAGANRDRLVLSIFDRLDSIKTANYEIPSIGELPQVSREEIRTQHLSFDSVSGGIPEAREGVSVGASIFDEMAKKLGFNPLG